MEKQVITPVELGQMLAVSTRTASRIMAAQAEHINVGTKKQQYLRLPMSVAMEIASGKRNINVCYEEQPFAGKRIVKKERNHLRGSDGLPRVAYKK